MKHRFQNRLFWTIFSNLLLLISVLGLLLPMSAIPIKAQTSTIHGFVTEPDGVTPVPDSNVELWPVGASAPIAWDTTLIDGSFAFATELLPLGQYRVIAHPPGEKFWASVPYTFSLEDNVTSVKVGVIRLTYPQIVGAVVKPDGLTRYERGDVNLRSADGTVSQWNTSGPDKNFVFGNLKPGSYTLQAMVPDDSLYWPPNPVAITVTESARIVEPGFVTITLDYPQVAGVVVEPETGKRVPTQNVNLYNADRSTSEWGSTTITTPFRFGGLPAGDYFLEASVAEEETPFWPIGPMAITLKEPGEYRETGPQAVTLTLTYVQVRGVVVEPDGVTRSQIDGVNLRNADSTISQWASTTITRPFVFGALPAGEYTLEVSLEETSPYWSTKPLSVTISEESKYQAGAVQFVTLTLYYPQVAGIVMEPDGVTPASTGDVNMRTSDYAVSLWATITAGKFRFGGAPEGTYLLEALPPEDSPFWKPMAIPLTIAEGERYPQEPPSPIALTLTYPQVVGLVVEPDGVTRIGGVEASLKSADGTVEQWGTSTSTTPFRFGGLKPGDYILMVYLPAGVPFWPPDPMPISLEEGGQYRPAEVITLTTEYPNVVGRLIYEGKPVAGAYLGASTWDYSFSHSTASDDEGYFVIGGLSPDRYRLDITVPLPEDARYWIGAPTQIVFELDSKHMFIDLGVIELVKWPPLIDSHLTR